MALSTFRQQPDLWPITRAPRTQRLAACDIQETEDSLVFNLDTPGLSNDSINVEVDDNDVLVISGERQSKKEADENMRWERIERSYGKFQRRFQLPRDTDTENISANYKNGELLVTVPKRPGSKANRRIPLQQD